MCRFACLVIISGLTLASMSLWTQVLVGTIWQDTISQEPPGPTSSSVHHDSSSVLIGSACAFSAVALLGITLGGLHVAVRMCSLASAAIFVLVFIATSCDDINEFMATTRAGGGIPGTGGAAAAAASGLNSSSSAVECTIIMAESYHSWIGKTYGAGGLFGSIARGPGDALYLIAAIRHISSTWRNVVASIRESIALLRRIRGAFDGSESNDRHPQLHRLIGEF